MKNLFNLSFLLIFFLSSCEENISYLGSFSQKYSLNCVLRNDSDIQLASIKRNYLPDEGNQNSDVQNALVRLILSDTTLQFRDSIISNNNSGSNQINSFYYLDSFRLRKNMRIKIEAILPDSTILKSETNSPYYYSLALVQEGGGPLIIPVNNSEDIYYTWEIFGNYETFIFGPSFYIIYYFSGDEENMNYKRVVGKHNLTYQYRIPTVNIYKAMQEIGNGLEDKSLINIVGACFEVKVFDKALGIYYNSVHTFEDEFSIRISESDVSNIDGGLGIFGTYVSEKFNIEITPEFITSYGYTTAP